MENSNSKDVEHKVQDRVDKITQCLRYLERNIESLRHTVQSQHAHVKQLLLELKTEETVSKRNDSRKCIHCTSEWQTCTKQLLGSIQDSLQYQSCSLLVYFEPLKSNIRYILEYYELDSGTSVDTLPDIDPLFYPETPEMTVNEYIKLRKEQEDQIRRFESSNQKLTEGNNQLQKSMDEERKRVKDAERKIKLYEDEVKCLTEAKETLDKRLTELESARIQIERLESLEREFNHLKEKRPVAVQLFYHEKGGMITNLLAALKGKLVDQIGVERHRLQFIVCHDESDVDYDLPLIVLCINASRLGTDTLTALQNIKVSSKVSMLIVHHRDTHALPNQPSCRVLTGSEYKPLGGIFDIAFLAEKGIYPCDMNRNASADLAQFLKSNC